MKLKDKVAVITGSSRGIGLAIAKGFSDEGAKVVLASRSVDKVSDVANEIKAQKGSKALGYPVDVRDPESVQRLISECVEAFGRVDIMVNNAGVSNIHPAEDLSSAEWARAVETDYYGVFYGCQAAAKQMISQGGGSILNITSIYGIVAAPGRAAYCSSKAASNMLTKVLAIEWADRNIRVNAIAPGYIRTDFMQEAIDKGLLALEPIEKRTPQKRIGDVNDVVGLAVYLASDESSYMTGSVITIDGGWTAYGYV